MPPEALEDESRYDVTIDIFSLGVLAIFALSQTFPKPLAPTYMDDNDRVVGRTELDRRGNYMREVTRQFREGHPMVQMIQWCLKNRMRERPTIQQVMGLLEEARAEIEDGEYDVNKLSLAQLLQSRNLSIQQQGIQIDQHQQQIRQNGQEICSLREQNEATKEQNDVQKAQITSLEEQVQALRAENTLMKKLHKVCILFVFRQSLPPFLSLFSRPHPLQNKSCQAPVHSLP